ncbi:FAD-dependent monooxygenase [Kutzneria sp. 744]|uniref:FAD-dependent monooxygenase n=1 Tax=Kutzneria sp. (strain 744) TaxID=345341 RepID=UPI0004B902F8|nr:FAD-dependent monooxygenase [Kutzneria sp. 744]
MDNEILIVGAGPTGLTLAVDLARRGVDHRIVDRDTEFAGSRGKGIQPRTLEVFADLGVLDAAQKHGGPYPPMRGYQDGQVAWERVMAPTVDARPDVPYPNPLMLPQWRTAEILRDKLTELGGRVEAGVEFQGFTQDSDGVTAMLDGQPVRARYLVGADGGRSVVRKATGVEFIGETFEQHRIQIADVRVTGLDRDHWHIWTNAEGPVLALCPMAGTDTFQLTTTRYDSVDLPGLVREIAGFTVTDVGWSSQWRANVRMVDRYRIGRVFLAGDAAHVHTPAGGQGLNTGVQDAYNLGWKLASGSEELLDSYESERLPIAADVLGISNKLFTRGIDRRDDAMDRSDPVLRQLGLHYRDSKLSVDTRSSPGSLRAGDRAPDGLAGSRRIHEALRGPQFTVLTFGAASYPGGVVVTDAPAYDIEDAYVVVRPDGYIGMIATEAADVRQYLGRW